MKKELLLTILSSIALILLQVLDKQYVSEI
jgi:hypothetical protein